MLTDKQLADYKRDGFLVLDDFVSAEACDELRARAEELVRGFDPSGVRSIFSTHEQTRTSDDYFLESGDKIRFFFEEKAFLPDGTLRQSKEHSINKIGHALTRSRSGVRPVLAGTAESRRWSNHWERSSQS